MTTINFQRVRRDARKLPINSQSPLTDRIGFWASVSSVDSTTNRVDVYSDTGVYCTGLPVYSQEWVNADSDKDYVTGSRNLPPIGARVFVLMPTHTIAGAFVLCSGYAMGEAKTKNLLASEDDKQQIKQYSTIKESITQGGWNIKEDYNNGNLSMKSVDENVSIEINLEDNKKLEQKKGITIKAFDYEIVIQPDKKMVINAKSDLTLNAGDKKMTLITSKFSVKSDENNPIADLEVT